MAEQLLNSNQEDPNVSSPKSHRKNDVKRGMASNGRTSELHKPKAISNNPKADIQVSGNHKVDTLV